MARGFESKDVEYQQAEAERLARPRPAATTDDRQRALELSLARMRDDLGRASAPPHRAMIEQAIAALEAQLRAHRDR